MLKIGLTGGIGCGKTVVANLFKRNWIEIIDADEIAHKLVEPGKAGLNRIVDRFGTNILDPHGHLNRTALRELVFNSSQQRKSLEAILHPLIYQQIESELSRLRGPYCIVCVPLLLETGRKALFDRILVIDCPVEMQVERVRIRDNLNHDQIVRILHSQAGREERLLTADDVISNDADLASLDKQVEKLHNFYSEISKR
ncbi:MAG: dephospho-CoA kinase [Methylococcales bacterium]